MYSTPIIVYIIGYGMTSIIIIIFCSGVCYSLYLLAKGVHSLFRRMVFPTQQPQTEQDIEMVRYVEETPFNEDIE